MLLSEITPSGEPYLRRAHIPHAHQAALARRREDVARGRPRGARAGVLSQRVRPRAHEAAGVPLVQVPAGKRVTCSWQGLGLWALRALMATP